MFLLYSDGSYGGFIQKLVEVFKGGRKRRLAFSLVLFQWSPTKLSSDSPKTQILTHSHTNLLEMPQTCQVLSGLWTFVLFAWSTLLFLLLPTLPRATISGTCLLTRLCRLRSVVLSSPFASVLITPLVREALMESGWSLISLSLSCLEVTVRWVRW